MTSKALRKLKLASLICRSVPLPVALRGGAWLAARLGPKALPDKAAQLARHLSRIDPTISDLDAAVSLSFGSYGRYWAESLRLPHVKVKTLDANFRVENYHHISDVLNSGLGPILVMPHLGGWEWAAGWLSRVEQLKVAAVVERLEPEEVYQWFRTLREGYGVEVIPLGPAAMTELVAKIKDGYIVALMADRDVAGTGVEVEFFGEKTKLPVGPALLARRTGAPLLPTAVFYEGRGYLAQVGEPIYPSWGTSLRSDLTEVTQELARHLERLIEQAPDQWHVLEPNWPSDVIEPPDAVRQ